MNPPNSEEFYKLLCYLADRCGETCGECEGFVCFDCYRGIIALYALRNDGFYKFLNDEKNKGVKGVDVVRKSLRVAIKV
jgi:hypothetical protein